MRAAESSELEVCVKQNLGQELEWVRPVIVFHAQIGVHSAVLPIVYVWDDVCVVA